MRSCRQLDHVPRPRGGKRKARELPPPVGRGQHIIMPWETVQWSNIKRKIEADIKTPADMDNRIIQLHESSTIRCKDFLTTWETLSPAPVFYVDAGPTTSPEPMFAFLKMLILAGPKTFDGFRVPILCTGKTSNTILNRKQIATMFACAWFGLFNYDDYLSRGSITLEDLPEFSLLNIFVKCKTTALQCVIEYFEQVRCADKEWLTGRVAFHRSMLAVAPKWAVSEMPLTDVMIGEGNSVDNSPITTHVTFASEYIGGEPFINSPTPEEAVMLSRPETMIASLICTKLSPADSLTVIGAHKISLLGGYGSSLRWLGPNTENNKETIININSSTQTGNEQFTQRFDIDLNKAYCGFAALGAVTNVATGNWGHGLFGGNPEVKLIQQFLAASQCGRILVYYPHNHDFEVKLESFMTWILSQDMTVGDLYEAYKDLVGKAGTGPHARLSELHLFESIMEEY